MGQEEDIQRLFDLHERLTASHVGIVTAQVRNDEQIKALTSSLQTHIGDHSGLEAEWKGLKAEHSSLGWKAAGALWGMILIAAGWVVSALSKP